MEEWNPNIPLRQSRPSHATLPHPASFSFPIACLQEPSLGERYGNAKVIEKAIQSVEPGFRIRVEHFATILLVPLQDFKKGGLFDLKYMLHLNPKNRVDGLWTHAKPQPVTKQPPLNDEMSYDEIILSMEYRASFKTSLKSDSPATADEKEIKCKKRDQSKCVLTGRPHNISVFWFIPRGWNDNVQHNNATGNLEAGSVRLAKVPLLGDIHSATKLRQTQKAWNILCVDKDIYDLLIIDLNLIKQCEPLDKPDRFTTFNYVKVKRENIRELSVDLHVFQRRGCAQPRSDRYKQSGNPNSTLQLMSGKDVYITMSERDSELFESVVKIHWACVTFTALCGGAGRSWFMTGKNQVNGSLQPRDAEFKEEQRKRAQASSNWRP
ncbi:hypothetical protein FAUST_9245 [Fusarium austroamericanum]|uniref:HNH nuclease domain-containing protein n=1 Tax=Fusarium austroamericanum TaxID=282268 RepID=A0AAN5Z319_FUSAU|nr:hypothetical protein FAUST_9245 [Fusarium austroamericanum]